jgi:hypothetical protein
MRIGGPPYNPAATARTSGPIVETRPSCHLSHVRRFALVLFALPGCDGLAEGQTREDAVPSVREPQVVVESATRRRPAPHGDDSLVERAMPLQLSSTSSL